MIARYGDAILAVHALEVARQSVDIASAHVAMARDRVDGGIAVESDLLQTRVQESATRQALDMAERDLELATGQDLGTPIHLPTSFEAIEPASRPRG